MIARPPLQVRVAWDTQLPRRAGFMRLFVRCDVPMHLPPRPLGRIRCPCCGHGSACAPHRAQHLDVRSVNLPSSRSDSAFARSDSMPCLSPDFASQSVRTVARIEKGIGTRSFAISCMLGPGLVSIARSGPRSEWLIVLAWSWGGVALGVWEMVLQRSGVDFFWSSSGLRAVSGHLGTVFGVSLNNVGWDDLGTS